MSNPVQGHLHTNDFIGLQEFIQTPENALDIIEGLRGGGKYRYSWDYVRATVLALALRCQAYRVYQLTARKVWRARYIESGKHFPSLDDLGPLTNTSEYGRCHKPGSPLFYCARDSEVALAEIDADLGSQYTLARFQIQEPLNVIAIGEFDAYWRTGRPYFWRRNIY